MKKTFNENKNYYALLGVSETASKDTLDKVIGDIARNSFNGQKLSNFQEDMLAELWEAYNVLSDSTTRKEYDLARKKKTKNNKTTETETPVENRDYFGHLPQDDGILPSVYDSLNKGSEASFTYVSVIPQFLYITQGELKKDDISIFNHSNHDIFFSVGVSWAFHV